MAIISLGLRFIPSILCGGIVTWRCFNNLSKNQNNLRNPTQESNIRDLFRQILEKNGIRNDIQFRVDSNRFPYAKGGNFTKYAAVFFNPELREIDEKAFKFAVKHEIGHVKHNDTIHA